ncbi:GntR family transcriptional regulator [Streptomyces sp. 135]|uniref:GntR family transcriptional regulator n=1 Tax=Streptomyces sp. 135 TaxID=2838850 RepID=UPI001CBE3C0C|nr:GntR family transcriptional regulator [Streptomyces sp. 135]
MIAEHSPAGPLPADARQPPKYQLIADDLEQRLSRKIRTAAADGQPPFLPDGPAIARRYHVTLTTAHFARRALVTRLRSGTSSEGVDGAAETHFPYQVVADALRKRIRTGQLCGRLPALSNLARRYSVCNETVAKAVRLLAREGVLVRNNHRGRYVTASLAAPPGPGRGRGPVPRPPRPRALGSPTG